MNRALARSQCDRRRLAGTKDEPENHTFEWLTLVATGDIWIAQGTAAYTGGRTYSNLWVVRPGQDG
ncbi:hypothetical protein [Mycetocola sp.]|uniref:hypothetical protein n=1 Tax=Mycetocola sp. TaxID=1871042 RepID=UPI002633D2BE|nr:hypothetical protein [Mycetocola sp.]